MFCKKKKQSLKFQHAFQNTFHMLEGSSRFRHLLLMEMLMIVLLFVISMLSELVSDWFADIESTSGLV